MKLHDSRNRSSDAKTIFILVLCFLAAGFLGGTYLAPAQISSDTSMVTEAPRRGLPDFVGLAKTVEPSVVHVSVVQKVQSGAAARPGRSPFGGEGPLGDFWEKFFGVPRPDVPFRRRGLGSGFIIDRDGYILTNNHVVADAENVVVKLFDDREYQAKIVGLDAKTDVALIKIDAADELQPAILGHSQKLQTGEWVAAMGSPFGLDKTLTAGIVSAKGRRIGVGPYDDYIQTDASINPGNSGGPLINLKGQVVGMNTAIFSRSGGNIGIGFATPIDLVKRILPELKEKGKVTRGWLGVSIQAIDPALAETLDLDQERGALVSRVFENSPAAEAGMESGDVIVEFDGKAIDDADDLPALVAKMPVGQKVKVKMLREGQERSLSVRIGELKDQGKVVASRTEKSKLGLAVQSVTPQIANRAGLDRAEGVIVTSVAPGSAADAAGLRRGDIILKVDREPVSDDTDFKRKIAKADGNVLFLIRRGESNLFVALNLNKPSNRG